MMYDTRLVAAGLVWGLVSLQGCEFPGQPHSDDAFAASRQEHDAGRVRQLDPALCALDRGGYTLRSTNDFFPLTVGSHWLLRGREEGVSIQLDITVLDETQDVGGVTTRVVEEREVQDGELVEVSRNFFAEARDGTVCYFGEDVDIYENGEIVSHEGAWRADAPGNRPGIIMPEDPRPGMTFQIEGAPGVAEDEGTIERSGRVRVPAGSFRETIRVREFNPLDGGISVKVFAEDVGVLIDGPVRLVRSNVSRRDQRGQRGFPRSR
jgi:hypothetical protein